MERKIKQILGFNVDLFSFAEALEYIKKQMNSSKGSHIITINPEMIEMAEKNMEFQPILKNADLIIPDGIGIKIALKINGITQEQIPGIEFSKDLISICADSNYSIALIGSKPEVVKLASQNLKNEYPSLNISYVKDGFFSIEDEDKIIAELQEKNPKLVLVALGAPKQELFINRHKKSLPETIFIGVGGSFDVWSGTIKRAPIVFRKVGCEWLYRVLKQPSRFKRIFPTLPLFLLKVLKEKLLKNK